MTISVIALPGGVNPAALRYTPLRAAFGGEVNFHLKDLEVYAGERPPADYAIDLEVEAVARFADSLGLERFHLLGYSAGGFISLAFAGRYRERLLSLALFEPAGVPGDLTADEAEFSDRLSKALAGLQDADYMRIFMETQLQPGVTLPRPAAPAPAWMRNRPAGIAALTRAFADHPFDRLSLRNCTCPVFLGYGDLTSEYEPVKVSVLARLFPDVHIRRFAGLHHFVPPEHLYTPEHVGELRRLWTRVDGDATKHAEAARQAVETGNS